MIDVQETFLLFFRLFEAQIIALIMTLPRIYAFLATSQLLNAASVPRMARAAAVLSLAVIVVPVNLAHVDGFDRTVTSYAVYFAKEYAIGFLLGYLVGWIFWSVQAAGALIDNQRGSAIASSIDPLQGHESSPLGILFSQAFLTYVFVTGAVLPILGLLYHSFVLWPATKALPIISSDFPVIMLALADKALRVVVILAGPIVAVMFLAEFALAMVSRFAPQMQVFILAMPIKSIIAIFILIFYFSILLPYATSQFSSLQGYAASFYSMLRTGETITAPPVKGPSGGRP
jgi:type III secretion protein T